MQLTKKVSKKDRSPQFANKVKRFDKDDTIVPGPGTYLAPDSCQIREPKHAAAAYRSGTRRELGNHILNKSNPGIGAYDLTQFNALGGATLMGGGAPSNFTLCYRDMNPTIRKVETNPSPRLSPTISYSKSSFCFKLTIYFLL